MLVCEMGKEIKNFLQGEIGSKSSGITASAEVIKKTENDNKRIVKKTKRYRWVNGAKNMKR